MKCDLPDLSIFVTAVLIEIILANLTTCISQKTIIAKNTIYKKLHKLASLEAA
jgi:hypothetical protein